MPALTTEDKLDYVVNVLKNTPEFSPNFHQVATDMGAVNANKAQIKFKAIVDGTGKYTLTGGKVYSVGDPDVPATPSKPAARAPKANGKATAKKDGAKPAAKKRKVEKTNSAGGDTKDVEEGEGDEVA